MARTAVRATISIPWKNVPLVTHYIPPIQNTLFFLLTSNVGVETKRPYFFGDFSLKTFLTLFKLCGVVF